MQRTNSLFFHYLLEYNTIFKENDVIYRRMAAQFGLSDSAFWILYCLRESATPLTQKQLCESMSLTLAKSRNRKHLQNYDSCFLFVYGHTYPLLFVLVFFSSVRSFMGIRIFSC